MDTSMDIPRKNAMVLAVLHVTYAEISSKLSMWRFFPMPLTQGFEKDIVGKDAEDLKRLDASSNSFNST